MPRFLIEVSQKSELTVSVDGAAVLLGALDCAAPALGVAIAGG